MSDHSYKEIAPYFSYWGKAGKEDERPTWHLLPYHNLDVAAVGWLLMEPQQPLCQRLASQLKVNPGWLQSWFSFCLMLHDLGKFARAFQNLVPDLSTELVPYRGECVYTLRHDSLGFLLWKYQLAKRLVRNGISDAIPEPWLEIVCGHHGQPPKSAPKGWQQHFMDQDELAAAAYVQDLLYWWCPDLTPLSAIDKHDLRAASWQLAGVAVLADWLGSNQDIFHYQAEACPLPDYWQNIALVQAPQALALSQWSQQRIARYQNIQQQFPFIKQLTPLQHYGAERSLGAGPQLFILEDVTGAGKTEAAMVLTHRLMEAGLAKGLYVALPTMATANAMYARLANSYRALFAAEHPPSLVLAHGAATLSDGFIESVSLPQQSADHNYGNEEQSASAYCNAWLADSRKKALLADVGVGTVDQALLGVLPARHQSLRLLGLSDKVLLVDEIHAYDPYMRSLLMALLEAHARQGGSAILLSATLPQGFRQQLLSGFAAGLTMDAPHLINPQQQDYPLATHLSAVGLHEQAIDTRQEVCRHVDVVRVANEDKAMELIQNSVQEGRSICWIRNTVKDARHSFEQLMAQPWIEPAKLTLFHSRFAMVDRQRIEADVLSRFGSKSGQQQRQGQVLIATQVVEQSLDLDFDQMISDLAPVDLLIQRAGRLQRHIRDDLGNRIETEAAVDERPIPCLYLLSPDPTQVEDDQWLRGHLAGTQAVYEHLGQLWLTATLLFENHGFDMPEDARHLIEGVYSEEAQEQIPEALWDASWQAQGNQRSQKGMGQFNLLRLAKGYSIKSAELSGGWTDDVHIPTRLSAESVTVALARVEAGVLLPYAQVERHAWALSQLSLPKYQWEAVSQLIPPQWGKVIEQLKAETPALRWCEVLPLVDGLEQYYHPEGGWNVNRREDG